MKWLNKRVYWIILILLAIYPVLRNEIFGYTIIQTQRHLDMLSAKSVFYNPWQYRILSPILVESLHLLLKNTFYLITTPEDPYLWTFRIFRFFQGLIILSLMRVYLNKVLQHPIWTFTGVLLASIAMGNATCASDYSFNTYSDIIFYLLAALVILENKNEWLLLPISIAAAFNRETGILIPILATYRWIRFKPFRIYDPNYTWPILSSGVFFVIIFIGLRWFYGMPEAEVVGIAPGPEALKFNLTDLRTYLELFSVILIYPILSLAGLKNSKDYLIWWFFILVPIWFIIHYYQAAVRESRLFLVPTLLIFIPMSLDYLKKQAFTYYRERNYIDEE